MTRRLSKEENFKVSLYSVALVSMQMGFIADKPTKIAKQGYFCVETDAKDKLERMEGKVVVCGLCTFLHITLPPSNWNIGSF